MNIYETFNYQFTKYFGEPYFKGVLDQSEILKIGDKAPLDIELKNAAGSTVKLRDFLTKKYLIVYFYPKDGSYNCTVQACEVRDLHDKIQNLDVEIVGISKDNTKSHLRFITKNSLNFRLLSDESLNVIKAFGVWVKRKYFNATLMVTQRSTFIINNEGVIVKVWAEVNPPEGHAKELYEYLKTLN